MTKPFVDYYRLLGISRNASANEIRKAYRTAAKKYHPDMNVNSSVEVKTVSSMKFLLIQEAKETLLDNTKRQEYNVKYDKYKSRQKQIDVYIEDTKITEGHEDYSSVWPKARTAAQNTAQNKEHVEQEKKKTEEQKRASHTFNELDEEKLRSISDRRYTKKTINGKKVQSKKTHNKRLSVSNYFLKELQKLAIRPHDNLKKYILRNKRTIAFITGASIATALFIDTKRNKYPEEQVVPETTAYTQTEYVEVPETTEKAPEVTLPTFEEDIVLLRIHKVEANDSLSKFSAESNTLMEEIKNYNGMNGNNVILGTKIRIPYIIAPEDLPYYTKVETYQGEDLEQYAESFETEAETICKLNPEAAKWDGTKYVVATDSLIVPDFITKDEYLVRKAADRNEQKTLSK